MKRVQVRTKSTCSVRGSTVLGVSVWQCTEVVQFPSTEPNGHCVLHTGLGNAPAGIFYDGRLPTYTQNLVKHDVPSRWNAKNTIQVHASI